MSKLILFLTLTACGQDVVIRESRTAKTCSTTQTDTEATITCPNGGTISVNNTNDPSVDVVDDMMPLYVGYYCNRIVLKLGDIYYINDKQLIPLYNYWHTVSNKCSVRLYKNKIQQKEKK